MLFLDAAVIHNETIICGLSLFGFYLIFFNRFQAQEKTKKKKKQECHLLIS